ncbi:hypothetical protein [Variovorax ginsengisoli]|uniref:Branched-chain amino acid ABC transporter permease n=1 Tax=Variovorax ginsengisoli TaxID=363844 RepID=A0ABT9SB14_9BURK|nr:hypothetical protein [Variovorax ginsengisoli]MDP9901543.1 hypothetical protein [Variovorax ginsengisoli]
MTTVWTKITRPQWLQAGSLVLAALVLAGVFMLYTRPGFLVMLVDQVWSCF